MSSERSGVRRLCPGWPADRPRVVLMGPCTSLGLERNLGDLDFDGEASEERRAKFPDRVRCGRALAVRTRSAMIRRSEGQAAVSDVHRSVRLLRYDQYEFAGETHGHVRNCV